MEFRLRKESVETMKELCGNKPERYRSYSTDKWEVIDDMNQWGCGKEIIDIGLVVKQHYNVDVYRVLPYPPGTKDVKDFFIDMD
jgi:hypothetical protein